MSSYPLVHPPLNSGTSTLSSPTLEVGNTVNLYNVPAWIREAESVAARREQLMEGECAMSNLRWEVIINECTYSLFCRKPEREFGGGAG